MAPRPTTRIAHPIPVQNVRLHLDDASQKARLGRADAHPHTERESPPNARLRSSSRKVRSTFLEKAYLALRSFPIAFQWPPFHWMTCACVIGKRLAGVVWTTTPG